MSDDTKAILDQIIELSQQLLSLINSIRNEAKENTTSINTSGSDKPSTELALNELLEKRDKLIRMLFQKKTREEIAVEINLVNEMISLDSQLSSEFQSIKQLLSEQVIRIKKSKKVTKLYQNY